MLVPGQVIAFVMFDIAVILVAARLCGLAAKKVGQPAVVGEIIAGVLLGPSLLGATLFGFDTPPEWLSCGASLANSPNEPVSLTACVFPPQARAVLNGIGQIALLLFMFLVGLELDLKSLKGKTAQVATVAVGVVAVPIVVGFLVSPVLYNETFVADLDTVSSTGFALFIGAFISITALPVMARILQEKGLSSTPLATVGVAAAAVVTVLMFMLVSVASGVSAGQSTGALATKIGLAVAYLVVMMVVVKPLLERFVGQPYEERAQKIGLISAKRTWSGVDEFAPAGAGEALSHGMFAWILIVVFFSGWVAHLLGINVIVGGFMAGLVLPVREGLIRDMTVELFDTVAIILLPIFLAFAGLNADFNLLFQNFGDALVGLLVFIVACIAAKWGGAAVLGRAAGLTGKEANLLGILMNCRGLLPLVVGLVGLQGGVISPVMNVVAITMALVTTAMTGPLFDAFNRRGTAAPEAEEVPA